MNSALILSLIATGGVDFAPQSHLVPWRHITLEFPLSCPAGAQGIKVFAMEPPNTSIQFNSKLSIGLNPDDKRLVVPQDSIESKSVEADTSEGKQTLQFRQWKQTSSDKSLSQSGVRGYVRYEADLYYQFGPNSKGSESPGSTEPTKCADYKSKVVREYFERKGITPSTVTGIAPADVAGRIIQEVAGTPLAGPKWPSATSAVTTGGDCGARTSLTEAWLRSVGIGARSQCGWLIWENGTAELHAKPEFNLNGWWIFLEPSRVSGNAFDYMGINGKKSPFLFATHKGFDISAEFKDAAGNFVLIEHAVSLQYPLFKAYGANGYPIPATVGKPKVTLSNIP